MIATATTFPALCPHFVIAISFFIYVYSHNCSFVKLSWRVSASDFCCCLFVFFFAFWLCRCVDVVRFAQSGANVALNVFIRFYCSENVFLSITHQILLETVCACQLSNFTEFELSSKSIYLYDKFRCFFRTLFFRFIR